MGSAAEDRGIACSAGLLDAIPIVGALLAAGDPGGARADVDTRLEQSRQLVDVGPQRVVTARIGFQREQGIDVVGCGDARRLGESGELGGVDADLVRAVRVHPDQLHVVTADDGVQRALADVAGGPLDHPGAVGRWSTRSWVNTIREVCTGGPNPVTSSSRRGGRALA